jgi:hypothetical protein
MNFVTVHNGSIALNVAVAGSGPLILCVHGFPELWCSWRHQIAQFSERGYMIAALDVRGYGRSTKPWEIEAYSLRNLASDIAAVIDQLVRIWRGKRGLHLVLFVRHLARSCDINASQATEWRRQTYGPDRKMERACQCRSSVRHQRDRGLAIRAGCHSHGHTEFIRHRRRKRRKRTATSRGHSVSH